jgi:hypothetical protein
MLSPASSQFTVLDGKSGKTPGTVAGQNPTLKVQFSQHLLLEVSRIP